MSEPNAENAYAAPNADTVASSRYGDSAGEHLAIKRGDGSAKGAVIVAFVLQSMQLGLWLAYAGRSYTRSLGAANVALYGGLGLAAAVLVFRDRWKCIEAFASRFRGGAFESSAGPAVLAALAYANYRGVMKLLGR